MRRAAIEKSRAIRTQKSHAILAHNGDTSECVCDRQANRFRKGQKQLGCGKPRCYTCHGEKLLKIPTIQELKAVDAERDGFLEVAA